MLAGCGGAGEGGPGKGGTRGGLLGLIISGYADMIRSSARGSKSFVRFFGYFLLGLIISGYADMIRGSARGSKSFVRFFGYFRYVIELQMQLTIFIIKVNGCIDVALVCICMEFVWSS